MATKTPFSLLNLVPCWRLMGLPPSPSRTRHARMMMLVGFNTPTIAAATSIRITTRIPISNMVTVTQTSASKPLTVTSSSSSSSSSSPTIQTKQDNDSILITQSALQQIHHLAKQKRPEDPSQVYLRVYVDAGGCSGFQYKFELEQRDKEDESIDQDEDVIIHVTNDEQDENVMEAYVVVDDTSLNYLKGSTLDYVREMIRSSFVIANNPQSESACGCGSSFAVKNFESNPALD